MKKFNQNIQNKLWYRIYTKVLIVLLFLGLVTSCSNETENIPEPPFEPVNIEFVDLLKHPWHPLFNGEPLNKQNIIFYDFQSIDDFSDTMSSLSKSWFIESFINIDFTNYQVIGTIESAYNCMCYEIEIVNITEFSDHIKVNTVSTYQWTPWATWGQYFHYVKIPKSDKPVIFEEEQVNYPNG